eukprot:gnl/MRDRNA2_/MRDRNA2_73611_c0_seq1.p1 gnl/MRDRNA2_/MRDRNA2_73611_c0~~gnl/MRDRNA2_/MRDRNA2_73611_c0_seq1.p1  ORF type:complete len:517 (-),score=47.71 gnl/MRDRNA2_/MRDRNA2_73611_c0_seq1:345-1691(-)
MLADVLIGGVICLCNIVSGVLDQNIMSVVQLVSMNMILITGLTGWHVGAAIVSNTVLYMFALFLAPYWSTLVWAILSTCAIGVLGLALDKQFMAVFLEHESNRTLLHHATDGFCYIHPDTNRIRSMSSNLCNLFGVCTSAYLYFNDVILEEDKTQYHDLLNSSSNAEVKPILLSFRIHRDTEITEFEAMVIPHTRTKNLWGLCLKIQGEVRSRSADLEASDNTTNMIERNTVQATGESNDIDDDRLTELSWVPTVRSRRSAPQGYQLLSEADSLAYSDSQMSDEVAAQRARRLNNENRSQELNSNTDHSAQTELMWMDGSGFKCTRCSRPPTLPHISFAARARSCQRMRRTRRSNSLGSNATHAATVTPPNVIAFALEDHMLHFQVEHREQSCCLWHATVSAMRSGTAKLLEKECDMDWRPFQNPCTRCRARAEDGSQNCNVCGEAFS